MIAAPEAVVNWAQEYRARAVEFQLKADRAIDEKQANRLHRDQLTIL